MRGGRSLTCTAPFDLDCRLLCLRHTVGSSVSTGGKRVFSMSAPAERLLAATDAERRECVAAIVARFADAFDGIAIDIAWKSDSLNAQAFRLGPTAAHVRVYGGLARHRDIGPEGLALAIAHEI